MTEFNIFVGAETGLLKGVSTEKNSWCNINSVDQASRSLEIKCMCWGNDNETEVCVGLRNQTVSVFNRDEAEITSTHNFSSSEKEVFASIAKIEELFLTCTESGILKLWNNDDETKLEVKLGPDIEKVRKNPYRPATVASGGEENDLKIWDLQKPSEPIFKAKNVRNDWLNLRVPVHIKDMAFLPGSEKICTCTAHHQVRLYDPSTSQRRPMLDMEWGEYPITAISLHRNGMQAVVGNTHGDMALLDLRQKGQQVHRFKGVAGSIRDIQCHPSQDLVASCGLDRFLRIHNLNDKSIVSKHYLKSRLNCLLFASSDLSNDTDLMETSADMVKQDCDSDDPNNDNTDDIWDNLTVVKTKTLKKRKKGKTSGTSDINQYSEEAPDKRSRQTGNNVDIDAVTDPVMKKKKKKSKQKNKKIEH